MFERPVDFLIIGAAKCATTWLQNSLQNSSDIFMPDPELHFFSREFDRGSAWYKEQFASAAPGIRIGEKSNSYLTHPEAAARIRAAFPDTRLIVQMRDPVERAYSDYCMLFRRGEVSSKIEQYLDPAIAGENRFIGDGLYAQHIGRFLQLFPREQMLLLVYEDIRRTPERQIQLVADHLNYTGRLAPPLSEKVKDKTTAMVPFLIRRILRPLRPIVDPLRETRLIKAIRQTVAQPVVYPKISAELSAKLRDHYAPDVAELEKIMGRDLSVWSAGSGH
jgi:Sulfotransferase family